MRKFLVFAALVCLSMAMNDFIEISDEIIKVEWLGFKSRFGKIYDPIEEVLRFKIFRDNAHMIRWMNSLNNGATFSINEFADLKFEEFRMMKMRNKMSVSSFDNESQSEET